MRCNILTWVETWTWMCSKKTWMCSKQLEGCSKRLQCVTQLWVWQSRSSIFDLDLRFSTCIVRCSIFDAHFPILDFHFSDSDFNFLSEHFLSESGVDGVFVRKSICFSRVMFCYLLLDSVSYQTAYRDAAQPCTSAGQPRVLMREYLASYFAFIDFPFAFAFTRPLLFAFGNFGSLNFVESAFVTSSKVQWSCIVCCRNRALPANLGCSKHHSPGRPCNPS